eukprot:734179-Hanusia_phi.AAC.2
MVLSTAASSASPVNRAVYSVILIHSALLLAAHPQSAQWSWKAAAGVTARGNSNTENKPRPQSLLPSGDVKPCPGPTSYPGAFLFPSL